MTCMFMHAGRVSAGGIGTEQTFCSVTSRYNPLPALEDSPMTPEQAADKAAEILDQATKHATVFPDQAAALVGVADGWTRLYTALAAHPPAPAPSVSVSMGETTIHEEADVAKLGADLANHMTAVEIGGPMDALYRERACLVAHLAAVYPSAIVHHADPKNSDWPIVFIDTPHGQLSWHLSPDDLDLFEHVTEYVDPLVPGAPRWDGHTTAEKYERLAAAVKAIDADARFPLGAS